MTKEEELKLGQELDKTNSSLRVRLSKNEYYDVDPFFTGVSSNNIEVEGIVISHWYVKDGHLTHIHHHSTLNDHPEVLREFEEAIQTGKYEITRYYCNHRNY